jgi:hypothetical protein
MKFDIIEFPVVIIFRLPPKIGRLGDLAVPLAAQYFKRACAALHRSLRWQYYG